MAEHDSTSQQSGAKPGSTEFGRSLGGWTIGIGALLALIILIGLVLALTGRFGASTSRGGASSENTSRPAEP